MLPAALFVQHMQAFHSELLCSVVMTYPVPLQTTFGGFSGSSELNCFAFCIAIGADYPRAICARSLPLSLLLHEVRTRQEASQSTDTPGSLVCLLHMGGIPGNSG